MAKQHWTQTPEGRARIGEQSRLLWKTKRSKMLKIAQRAAKNARAAKKLGGYKPKVKRQTTKEPVSVQILGWRFIFEGEEIKIERA